MVCGAPPNCHRLWLKAMAGTRLQRLLVFALALQAAPAMLAIQAHSQPPAPTVTVANPLEQRIVLWDEYTGRFEAMQRVEVRPRVSGFIETIHFKDGQKVAAGDLLFTLDKRPFALAVENARAEVARAKAQVELGMAEVERARPLVKSRAVTERDFDQRSADLAVARANLRAAEATLRTAELHLEWAEVRAPIAGRISDRKIDAGNLVNGGEGSTTLLATIVTVDPIHFVFDVAETDYLRYARLSLSGARTSGRETAHPVRIRLADESDFVHEGQLDFVDNALNPRAGTMRGRAVVQNRDELLQPGLFGRVRLFGGETDALLVPDSAILSDQARKIVLVVDADETVKGAPVELGPLEGGLRVVRSGINPADRVVINGLANPMVRQGVKVVAEPGRIEVVAKDSGSSAATR